MNEDCNQSADGRSLSKDSESPRENTLKSFEIKFINPADSQRSNKLMTFKEEEMEKTRKEDNDNNSERSDVSQKNIEGEKWVNNKEKKIREPKELTNQCERNFSIIIKKYENNQEFMNPTHDFIKKLETHFKNKKSSQEWTSFLNTVHNLYLQHIKKLMKKKDHNINEKIINEYFIYLLYMTNEKEYFTGDIFKNWRENGLKTLEEMNDYCMININLGKLREDISITSIKSFINISENDKSTYLNIFSEVFKILQSNNFWQPKDGTTSETRYLNNIQHFINNYANSNKWSLEERDLIKKDKRINKIIFDSLIEMKLIQTKLNIVEFNQFEISNFPASDNKYLLGN